MGNPASGANTALYYIEEVTAGITPDTPEWKTLRFTGGIPTLSRDAIVSAELDGSRDTKDVRSGNKTVGGDISVELSYGSFDDLLEGALQSEFTNDVLKVGSTVKSFSLMVHYGDMPDGLDHYDIITGVEVAGFSLDVSVNSIAGLTLSTNGRDYQADVALPDGSTFAAPTTTSPMTGIDGALLIDSSVLGFVTSVSPANDNSAEPSFALGSTSTAFISYGRANNTFTMEAAFSNYDMFSKFTDEVEFDASLTMSYGGDSYIFNWPRCRVTSGAPTVEGEGTIIQSMDVQALRDPTAESSLIITRVPKS